MKSFVKDTFVSVLATLLFAVVCCGIYPAVIWGAGQLLFPHQANGSLLVGPDQKLLGSRLLGQSFSGAKYFHPRPSAAGTNGYDAANSSGTNLGPTSQKLIDSIKERVGTYRTENGLAADALVPGDAVTSSGSGLDPHISVKNALLQAPRIARERSLPEEKVRALVAEHTAGAQLGLLGDAGVNVLTLNLALDGVAVTRR